MKIGSKIALALGTVYVVWGSTYFAMRLGLTGFPPFFMAGLRFTLAGSMLYAFLRARGAEIPRRTEWIAALRIGTLLLVCGNGSVVFAQQSVSSSMAAIMVASVPLWSALFSSLWGDWPHRREWIGLLLGIAGVAVLTSGGELHAQPAGAFLLLFASITWALGSVWSRRLPLPSGAMSSAAQMICAGPILLTLSLIQKESLRVPSFPALSALIYLIFFGSILGFSAFGYMLRHARPTLATSYAYINPVVAVLLGWGLGGEPFSLRALIGGAIVLCGVALVLVSPFSKK